MKKIIRTTLLSAFLSLSCLVVVSPVIAEGERTGSADNGMCISKTAEINSDGSYTITLEAYATGSKVITEEKTDVPTDIILVLDQSGSMADTMYTYSFTKYTNKDNDDLYDKRMNQYWNKNLYYKISDGIYAEVYVDRDFISNEYIYTYYYLDSKSARHELLTSLGSNTKPKLVLYERKTTGSKTRLQALQDAVTTFSDNVAKKAKGKDGEPGTEDDINHRIAVVGYASGTSKESGNTTGWLNTELFIGSKQYNYNVNASRYYGSSFQDMNKEEGYQNILASNNALDSNGATYTNYGLEMANNIFNAYSKDYNKGTRNKVIVLFTDGYPGINADNFNKEAAEKAINQAKIAKDNGVSVYAVGIYNGADPTSSGSTSGSNIQAANWFMQKVSSNNGTPQNPSYFLSASDADSLNDIFKKISEQIESGGTSVKLNEDAVVKDIISPQFELLEGTKASDITVETYQCTGEGSNGWKKNGDPMGAEVTISGNEVSVTGFDFAENYVGTVTNTNNVTSYRGNKLVIQFKVQAKAGFLGGNNVYTNVSADIYETSSAKKPVVTFNRPQVNVPIKNITVSDVEKNVYLLNGLTADQLKSGLQVDCEGIPLNLSSEAKNYGLEDWQTEYVNIEVKIYDSNNKEINGFDKLEDDTSYYVSVSISPKENANESSIGAEATTRDGKGKGSIFVFTPELTVEDSIAYYGDTAPTDFSSNRTIDWKHGDNVADTKNMGNAPDLSLKYDLVGTDVISNGKINTKNDIPVDITSKIGDVDVTNYTTFTHTDCKDITDAVLDNHQFWIHVKTCNLTISKSGGSVDETYVFKIKKDGSDYTEVSITGNDTVTINELPVGEYTVEEDTAWSWRYSEPTITYSSPNKFATLSSKKPKDTVSVTNNRKSQNWLNGFSTVVQNIFGKANN